MQIITLAVIVGTVLLNFIMQTLFRLLFLNMHSVNLEASVKFHFLSCLLDSCFMEIV